RFSRDWSSDVCSSDLLGQHRGHGARGAQVFGEHGPAAEGAADVNAAQPIFQVVHAVGQAQDGHHFGSDGNVEAGLARHAVGAAAQADDDVAQLPIVDVQHARPKDGAGIDAQFVAVVDVVVDEGGQQVVGRAHGVDVAGEVQVDLGLGHDAGPAAARGPAFDPEHGAHGR